eukprot:Gb_21418 [translate_table: standard]
MHKTLGFMDGQFSARLLVSNTHKGMIGLASPANTNFRTSQEDCSAYHPWGQHCCGYSVDILQLANYPHTPSRYCRKMVFASLSFRKDHFTSDRALHPCLGQLFMYWMDGLLCYCQPLCSHILVTTSSLQYIAFSLPGQYILSSSPEFVICVHPFKCGSCLGQDFISNQHNPPVCCVTHIKEFGCKSIHFSAYLLLCQAISHCLPQALCGGNASNSASVPNCPTLSSPGGGCPLSPYPTVQIGV